MKGNVVVAGHRFRYKSPLSTPFYTLDQVVEGDPIYLRYNGVEYRYEVLNSFVVSEEEVWVEKDYTFPSITLYTCTPIYNPKDRLVVVGKLVSIQ